MSLKRRLANKLAGVFTPSLLIVLITFTTYFLGPGSISDRVTIGITAFLAIIQSFASARSLLPPISYVSVGKHFISFHVYTRVRTFLRFWSSELKREILEMFLEVLSLFFCLFADRRRTNYSSRIIFGHFRSLILISHRKSGSKEKFWKCSFFFIWMQIHFLDFWKRSKRRAQIKYSFHVITSITASSISYSEQSQNILRTFTLTVLFKIQEIDVWMLLCMLFVAFQLLQATIVHFLYESAKMKAVDKERGDKVAKNFLSTNKQNQEKSSRTMGQITSSSRRQTKKNIDDDDDGRMTSSTTTSTIIGEEEERFRTRLEVMFATVASSKTPHSFTLLEFWENCSFGN